MGAPLKVSLMEGIGAQLKLMLIWDTLWEKAIGVTADHLVFLKVQWIIVKITINFYINLFRCPHIYADVTLQCSSYTNHLKEKICHCQLIPLDVSEVV